MIPHALVLLLLVAPTITVAGAAATPSIDWAECKIDVHCIFAATCAVATASAKELAFDNSLVSARADCDVGISIRPFSTQVWLARVSVVKANLDAANGISFFAGNRSQFGCLQSNGTLKATGDAELKPELYGDDSHFTPAGGYCTLLIKDALSLPTLHSVFKIVYSAGGKVIEIKTPRDTKIFGDVQNYILCDPFSLTADYTTPLDGYNKAPIPDVLKEPPSCEGIPYAKLFVSTEPVTHLECKRDKKKYYFKRSEESPETALKENEEVFCAISIGTTCKDIIYRSRNTPKYSKDPSTGQTSLKCDNSTHMILVNDEFYFDGAPECWHSEESHDVGEWRARPPDNSPAVPIYTAQCTNQIRCDVISSFNVTVPAGELYENVYLEDGNLSCADDAFLRVNQASHNAVLKPTLITCDFTTGIYRMDQPDRDVEQGANVYCEVSPDAFDASSSDAAAVAGAGAGTIVGIAGGAALLVLIGVIAGIFWFFLIRRRKNKKPKARPRMNHSSIGLPSSSSGPGNNKRRRRRRLRIDDNTPYLEIPTWVRRNLFYTGVCKMKNGKMKKIDMASILKYLDLAFKLEIDPTVWQSFLPFLFFVERDFFHADMTNNHTIAERAKVIPGFCHERLRLFLLDRADKWLEEWKDTRNEKAEVNRMRRNDKGERAMTKGKITRPELGAVGFIRGVLLIMKYKLNIMSKEEKAKIVDRVTDIFLKKNNGMDQVDSSRFAIWGILHHEETGSKRCPGVHERFGYATGQRVMFEYLWDEFNKLLKQPLEPRPVYGSKMQHVLFAMGCALEREPMAAVWKVMKEDKRFIAQDYMWAMYGRDWLWDGAWVCFFQDPPEHHLFCDRFSQECKAYKELAEMLTRYWPDKYSADAKDGYCFEGFMRKYDPKIEEHMLWTHYKWFEKWERNRHKHGVDVCRYLIEHDKRVIPGYTPVDGDELVAQAKEGWEKRSDRQSIERLLQQQQQGGKPPAAAALDPAAEQPTQPIEELLPAAPAAAAAVPAAAVAAAPKTAQPKSSRTTTGASGTGITGTGTTGTGMSGTGISATGGTDQKKK